MPNILQGAEATSFPFSSFSSERLKPSWCHESYGSKIALDLKVNCLES